MFHRVAQRGGVVRERLRGRRLERDPEERAGLLVLLFFRDPERPLEPDPDVVYAGVEDAALFRTVDGGQTWQPRNQGIRADFLPEDQRYPEFGQCVHKVVNHPSRPERLFLQNHWGLYRSDDWGDEWQDVANGVPSDFGFAMAMHPHDPDTVFVVPLESDMVRVTPETEPVRSMPGMGDHPTATALYAAIVTALYRRERTGQGGVVQTSLLQNGLWANGCFVQNRLFGDGPSLDRQHRHRRPGGGTGDPAAGANGPGRADRPEAGQ